MEDGSSLRAQQVRNAGDTADLGLIPGLGRFPGGRHGNPLQYSWLENSHGQRSLEGYHPWGCKESDTTERLSTAAALFFYPNPLSLSLSWFHLSNLDSTVSHFNFFWLPKPSIASFFFGKISALCWICYYIRICMLRNSEENAQPHELLWQQSYASWCQRRPSALLGTWLTRPRGIRLSIPFRSLTKPFPATSSSHISIIGLILYLDISWPIDYQRRLGNAVM